MILRDQRGFSLLQIIITLGILGLLTIGGNYFWKAKSDFKSNNIMMADVEKMPQTSPFPAIEMANPASVNCEKQGGQLLIRTLPKGDQYGVCVFPEDQECEEWALYHGDCPDGGVKTIGYDTPEQIYCAITGGKTTATKNPICTFEDGSRCSANAYFNGSCQKGQIK